MPLHYVRFRLVSSSWYDILTGEKNHTVLSRFFSPLEPSIFPLATTAIFSGFPGGNGGLIGGFAPLTPFSNMGGGGGQNLV